MTAVRFRGRAGAAAALVVVTACLAATAATAATTARSGARASRILVVDTAFVLKTADPAKVFEPTGAIILHAVYDNLLTFNGSNVKKPVPQIAASYSQSDGAKKFVFKLRKNVRFSDGSKLTSADVVFSLNRMKYIKSSNSLLLDGVTISAKGPYTVVFTSDHPYPGLPFVLPSPPFGIVEAKLVRAHGGLDTPDAATSDKAESFLNSQSAGSGPYTITSFDVSSQVSLSANPHYWGKRKPAFARIVLRNADANRQKLDVIRGDSQLVTDLAGDLLTGLPGSLKRASATVDQWFLYANANSAVSATTSNPHFWAAVRYGLDYKGLVALAGFGARQAPGVIPSSYVASLPLKDAIKRNVAKAKAQVKALGIANPTASLIYPTITFDGIDFGSVAAKIKSDLAQVGITINLSPLPIASFLAQYRSGKSEMGITPWQSNTPDPSGWFPFAPGDVVGLRVGWTPQNAAKSVVFWANKCANDTKPAARIRDYVEFQKQLNSYSPIFPMFQTASVAVGAPQLTGVNVTVAGWRTDLRALGWSQK
jgi:peptide/nickel transport system substrate-binding protein